MFENGYGQAVPDPMGAGAFAPGYEAWCREQAERDWDRWALEMRLARLDNLNRRILDTRRRLRWYETAGPGWHLARLVPSTRAALHEAMRQYAVLLLGGDPYA